MPLENLRAGDLAIDATEEPGVAVRLAWSGKSIDRYPGKILGPYVAAAIAAAAQRGVALELHLERLEHFNSATMTVIIQAVQEARARNVRAVLRYDQAQKAQKLSFEALRVFVKGDNLFWLKPIG